MGIVKSYPSKISYGLFIPLCLLIAAALVTVIVTSEIIGACIIAIVTCVVILPMLLNTQYTITDDTLNIRCGFLINRNIDIATIRKIVSTNSILSAPALSVKNRIELFYNKYDSVVISPKDIRKFANTLKEINPDISVEL